MQRSWLICLVVLSLIGCSRSPVDRIGPIADAYIDSWTRFYPTRALTAGRAESAPDFENLSQTSIESWVASNRGALEQIEGLPAPASLDERIDRAILTGKIRRELYLWEEIRIQRIDPQIYSDLINHALTALLVRSNLGEETKIEAAMNRLRGLQTLVETTERTLMNGRPGATEASIRDIRSTADFIRNGLPSALGIGDDDPRSESLATTAARTADELDALATWMETELNTALEDAYGRERYAELLALTYGDHMTPERLEKMASAEIETVRGLMEALARRTWVDRSTDPVPDDFEALIRPMLVEMEAANAGHQEAFLQEFLDLTDRSEQFLKEQDLVDLPGPRTLFTALSPSHFAGAAVGGVYSSGPFDPEAETLFYLPSVPDTAPEAARDGFYRSFNTAFNTMIITHEIYPGHYHQLKVAAAHPSRIRPLFAGNDFTEGWASFCEQMTLDAGWDGDRPLTRMAHLRKRLENAVRAHVSVQVHCREWDADKLHHFAVETGLLPPQFAENLWHRALLSPLQLPSYFVGFRIFDEAFRAEQTRLGRNFSTKDFNNAVIDSGGIPMEFVTEYLEAAGEAGEP